MRIVYMGTPDFARRPLVVLGQSEHEVLAVVTGRPKRTGRSNTLVPTAVALEAERQGLETLTPRSLKESTLAERISALKPDLIVVVAFRLLPKSLFSIPKYGSINIHGSLLPKYRGAAPINWALINGEKETGLSSFFLKQQVDTGDVINQVKTAIGPDENFDSLYDRLSEMAGPLLLKTIEQIENGTAKALPQDESLATPAPKITPFDALIDFGFPAQKVIDFIRGLSTKPAAYTHFREKKVKLLAGRIADEIDIDARPGSVIPDRKRLLIQCAHSAIEITSLIPDGKKMMDGRSFVNGMRPTEGEIFGKIFQKANRS